MYPPILPGRSHSPGQEGPGRERRLEELSRGYEGSPWLTALVLFSGFLAAFVGSFAAVLMLINLPNGGELPFALILAAVVGFTQPCGRCATTGAAPPAGGIPDRTRRTWLVSGSGPIA